MRERDIIIEAKEIHKSFGTLEILKGISLTVYKGEIVAIVGASGAGKTTLLQILSTLDQADSGQVLISGRDVSQLSSDQQAELRNQNIGFVFQSHQLLPEFTAQENVAIPAMIRGVKHKEAMQQAALLLQQMALGERLKHKPAKMSGGEKQRVAVARALINQPDIIFADEPTGALDSERKEELYQIFLQLRAEERHTFVIVSHDPTISEIADRTIHLQDGAITH